MAAGIKGKPPLAGPLGIAAEFWLAVGRASVSVAPGTLREGTGECRASWRGLGGVFGECFSIFMLRLRRRGGLGCIGRARQP